MQNLSTRLDVLTGEMQAQNYCVMNVMQLVSMIYLTNECEMALFGQQLCSLRQPIFSIN